MIDSLLHPAIVWPLLLNAALGFAAGVSLKRPIWRFVVWPLIAMAVALSFSFRAGNLFTDTGESGGWARIYFRQLAPSGFAACGLGLLFGYIVRRVSKRPDTL